MLKQTFNGDFIEIPENSGGGATIADTTNLITGDGAGNGVNSGKTPATVLIGSFSTNQNLITSGSPTTIKSTFSTDNNGNFIIKESASGSIIFSISIGGAPSFSSPDGTQTLAVDNLGVLINNSIRPVFLTFDTGWTANADNGDKTIAVPVQANSSAAIAALDPTSSIGLAALFAYYSAAAEKVKAIEAILASSKLPNA